MNVQTGVGRGCVMPGQLDLIRRALPLLWRVRARRLLRGLA